jgi:hypothetical protein
MWNPFAQPYWTHNLEPFTRWETRPGTVQVPVARTDWVEETRTAQVPITEYRTVNDETITRTAISRITPTKPCIKTEACTNPTNHQNALPGPRRRIHVPSPHNHRAPKATTMVQPASR